MPDDERRGQRGIQGEMGPGGEQGGQGESGLQGEAGAVGQSGQPGETGLQGETGATGQTGATGSAGQTGASGASGATGQAGRPGLAGQQGVAGPRGVGSTDSVLITTAMQLVDKLAASQRRVRQQFALTVVLVLLVAGVFAFSLHTNRVTLLRQCQEGNVTRVQDIAIWNRLLEPRPGAPAPTAAQHAEVAELQRLIKRKDTPKDCAAIYGGFF